MQDYTLIADAVKKYSPVVASLITAVNPAAGSIINIIASIFGLHPDDPTLADKINQNPEAAVKLKQIEYLKFITPQQIAEDDRKNAREREEKIVDKTGKRDYILDTLAIIFVVGFLFLCCLNYFFNIKDNSVMIMMIGQVSAGVGYILSYYFGSSNK